MPIALRRIVEVFTDSPREMFANRGDAVMLADKVSCKQSFDISENAMENDHAEAFVDSGGDGAVWRLS